MCVLYHRNPKKSSPNHGDIMEMFGNIHKIKKSLYINRLGAVPRLDMRSRGGAPPHVQLWVF